jgi:superfamily II DNA or RNA helicase
MAATKVKKQKKTPRTYKPDNLTLEDWQIALRREFGREQRFRIENTGEDPVFSDFDVTNPQTDRTYRVSIRGVAPGDNYCTCPDFSVNTLGTCKHIEFALARIERKGGKRKLAAGYRPPFSEIWLRYGAQRQVVLRRGSEWKERFTCNINELISPDGTLSGAAIDRFEGFLLELRNAGNEVRCHDDALEFIAQRRDLERLANRVNAQFPAAERSAAFKHLLKVQLYPYQRRGALFVARAGRSLLADDMGLGKTIQALAGVEILARAVGVQRVLIISPTSLKHQWRQEIEKFTRRDAMVIEGGIATRMAKYQEESFYKIVNYDVLKIDRRHIEQWGPDLIILDEAQRIKNWKTRAAQIVKRLKSQYAIVLTGTPLENRLEELHSIVEFVDRFRLGPSFRFLHEHQQRDEGGRVVGYHNLSSIAQTLAPVMIRRTKSEVLKELPERIEKNLFVPMTPEQMEWHDENRAIVVRIVARWRKMKFLTEADQRRLTCALQNMRMSCNSTYLLDPKSEHGAKPDELISQLSEVLETHDAKAVVFSQWTRSHELLMRRLKGRGIDHVFFHGGVPGPHRKDLIARFKEERDCRVFLSTDAGGVGLNLQNASAVFNMDLPWNPAVLEQRIGRVHRLGQANPVHVINFVSQGTIEHGMLDLLKFKKSLFAGVLDGGQDEVFLGGTRLKKFMESVETATGNIPDAPPPTEPISSAEEAVDAVESAIDQVIASPAPGPDVWSQLISAGKLALDSLASALVQKNDAGAGSEKVRVERDAANGRTYLKLEVPEPEVLGKAMLWLQTLAGALSPTQRK